MNLIITISLMITGVYVSFLEGNVLSPVRVWLANILDKTIGKKWSRYIQKPLWDCLPCMASVWTIIFYKWDPGMMLAVCGANAIIDQLIPVEDACKD